MPHLLEFPTCRGKSAAFGWDFVAVVALVAVVAVVSIVTLLKTSVRGLHWDNLHKAAIPSLTRRQNYKLYP
jgi:hypothetical protein